MPNRKINFFGPADLIPRLYQAKWEPCVPEGRNFSAIGLAGYCLTDTPDKLCPSHYIVIITKKGTDESFSVEGFSFSTLFKGMDNGPPAWKANKILDKELATSADGENQQEYELEVDG